MTFSDFLPILPLIVLVITTIMTMVIIAVHRSYRAIVFLTLAGFVLAFICLPITLKMLPQQVTPLMIVDGYATFYTGLILATSFGVGILSYGYMASYQENREEFYLLLGLATIGSIVLVVSDHFASFFLGLEILSVSLYSMIAYPRFLEQRIEAAIKYLILAGGTSAFMLFGMALIYTVLGTMEFSALILTDVDPGMQITLLLGWGLLSVGVGFKLALVPFHLWTPDVYQGAPAPVTGFIATVSKGGMFALALRYFSQVPLYEDRSLWGMFAIISVASMLFGNLLALLQDNVKRILAYSSIAHLGYLLVAFLSSGPLAPKAVAFYLSAYFVTTLSAFGVLTMLSTPDRDMETLSDYHGLFQRHPWLTVILSLSLLSLAGIPPTAGLLGKIYIAAAGVQSALWALLIILVVASVIGVFYYIRVVITMFRQIDSEASLSTPLPSFTKAGGIILGLLMFFLVGLGLYPAPLFRLIERLMSGFA